MYIQLYLRGLINFLIIVKLSKLHSSICYRKTGRTWHLLFAWLGQLFSISRRENKKLYNGCKITLQVKTSLVLSDILIIYIYT